MHGARGSNAAPNDYSHVGTCTTRVHHADKGTSTTPLGHQHVETSIINSHGDDYEPTSLTFWTNCQELAASTTPGSEDLLTFEVEDTSLTPENTTITNSSSGKDTSNSTQQASGSSFTPYYKPGSSFTPYYHTGTSFIPYYKTDERPETLFTPQGSTLVRTPSASSTRVLAAAPDFDPDEEWHVVTSNTDDVFAQHPVGKVATNTHTNSVEHQQDNLLGLDDDEWHACSPGQGKDTFIHECPFTDKEHNLMMGAACFVEDMTEEERADHWVQKARDGRRHSAQQYELYYERVIRPAYLINLQDNMKKLDQKQSANGGLDSVHNVDNQEHTRVTVQDNRDMMAMLSEKLQEVRAITGAGRDAHRKSHFTIFITNVEAGVTPFSIMESAPKGMRIFVTLARTIKMKTTPPMTTNAALITFKTEDDAETYLEHHGVNPLYFWSAEYGVPVQAQFQISRRSVHPRLMAKFQTRRERIGRVEYDNDDGFRHGSTTPVPARKPVKWYLGGDDIKKEKSSMDEIVEERKAERAAKQSRMDEIAKQNKAESTDPGVHESGVKVKLNASIQRLLDEIKAEEEAKFAEG